MNDQEGVDVQAGPVHVRALGFYTTIVLCTAGIIGAQFGFHLMHQGSMDELEHAILEQVNHNRDLIMRNNQAVLSKVNDSMDMQIRHHGEMLKSVDSVYFATVFTHSRLQTPTFLKDKFKVDTMEREIQRGVEQRLKKTGDALFDKYGEQFHQEKPHPPLPKEMEKESP